MITVTSYDIGAGDTRCPESCPIALAILRDHPQSAVAVYDDYMVLDDKRLELPIDAQRWIYQFDAGNTVEPITFTAGKGESVYV